MFSRRHDHARRRHGRIAAVLLVAFCAGPLVVPHMDPGGDVEWSRPSLVAHDASAHRVGVPVSPSTEAPEHCAVCHLGRASCSAGQLGDEVVAQPWRSQASPTASLVPVSRRPWTLVPGRAPPA
jgi:hypothetical protein